MMKVFTVAMAALILAASVADARVAVRRNNPPGPRGGRGTNWWIGNPPGPRGGPGAGPRFRNRVLPLAWAYWAFMKAIIGTNIPTAIGAYSTMTEIHPDLRAAPAR